MRRIGYAMLVILALWPSWVHAKFLYVNASGSPACSDATTYANNSEASPWCLIGRAAWGSSTRSAPVAAQAAQAGDTVFITAGTYTTEGASSPHRWDVALNPENSGTSGNPITFRGVGVVMIHLSGSAAQSPTIGANSRNYIVWDNVRVDEELSPGKSREDTGPVIIFNSIGSQIIRCTFKGATSSTRSDNQNIIRVELSSNILVKNNTLTTLHHATQISQNFAAIMMYDTRDSIFEHNTIDDVDVGIFEKGDHGFVGYPQQNNIFRFNRVSNVQQNCIGLGASSGSRVYQNLLKGCGYGGQGGAAFQIRNQGGSQSTNITIQNNTIISTNPGNDAGTTYLGTSNIVNERIFNNIWYGPFSEVINLGGNAYTSEQHYEHNVYYGYGSFASWSGVGNRTFADWQGVGKESVSPAGLNNTNPLFVNETDYKLQDGSPASALGVDILDLDGDGSTSDTVPAGAYITGAEVIGVLPPSTTSVAVSGGVRITGSVRIQ